LGEGERNKKGCGHATCLRFSHKGDFLAAGRLDGTIAIFDVDTNGVARKLRGHFRQIQSLRHFFFSPIPPSSPFFLFF
jgi:COMPASS component SWD1